MSFYEKYLKYKNKYLSLKNFNQTGGGEKEDLLAEVARLNEKMKTLVKLDDLKDCYIKLFNTYERLVRLFPEPQLIEQQKAFQKSYNIFLIKVINKNINETKIPTSKPGELYNDT
jgi:hypothetical protein